LYFGEKKKALFIGVSHYNNLQPLDLCQNYLDLDPSFDSNFAQLSWLPIQRWAGDFIIGGDDDGIVPLSSAAPQQFEFIGVTNNCHMNLFQIYEEMK
jgi:hypothetical protein